MTKQKVNRLQLQEALKQSHGMITGAAEILGVARLTIYKYLEKWPDCREQIETWKVRRKDRAEYKLDEAIERGESWAIMFCLKNSDRGYSDKMDLTSGGEAVQFIIKERDAD